MKRERTLDLVSAVSAVQQSSSSAVAITDIMEIGWLSVSLVGSKW